jgi:hypothetical protein
LTQPDIAKQRPVRIQEEGIELEDRVYEVPLPAVRGRSAPRPEASRELRGDAGDGGGRGGGVQSEHGVIGATGLDFADRPLSGDPDR